MQVQESREIHLLCSLQAPKGCGGEPGGPVPEYSLQKALPTGPGGKRAKTEATDQPLDRTPLHSTLHGRQDGFVPTFNSETLIEQLHGPRTALPPVTQTEWEQAWSQELAGRGQCLGVRQGV